MSMFIEAKRALLEDLDTIEGTVAKRLRRDPQLLEAAKGKHALLKQYELRCFDEMYTADLNKLNNAAQIELVRDEISSLSEDLHQFDDQLEKIKQKHVGGTATIAEDINRMYAPFSSVLYHGTDGDPNIKKLKSKVNQRMKLQVKRKCVLSMATQHISLENKFSPEENSGKFLDLAPFHQKYLQLGNTGTYVEYLNTFATFPYNAANENYQDYLNMLLEYLEDFVRRSQPLFEGLERILDVESFKPVTDGTARSNGEVWCGACEKLFSKMTVYQGHLQGKKHKNALKKGSDFEPGLLEWKIANISKYLEPTIDATKSAAERSTTLTDREKLIERSLAGDDDSDYTTVPEDGESSESDADSDYAEENLKDLPLGIDGRPMPFWLYKLQGLHKTYTCEICGNTSYKGRLLFSKHFLSNKHQHGLKFLGVDDESVPLFKNVTEIAEAIELWKRLKKEKRVREGDEQNAVEVEDSEGNVMSERDYLELKKQGLL